MTRINVGRVAGSRIYCGLSSTPQQIAEELPQALYGDLYMNTETLQVFVFKKQSGTQGVWAFECLLKGDKGEKGDIGTGVYDAVIRTQAEFEALYSSADWLGAKSVAFVGNGGALEFTRDMYGLKIPATVQQIAGFNNAKIRITNFRAGSTYGDGAIIRTSLNSVSFSIRDIQLYVDGDLAVGFTNCINMINCVAIINESGTGVGEGAFLSCNNLCNCRAVNNSAGGSFVSGFNYCTNMTNCTVTANSSGARVRGFDECNQITNCESVVKSNGANASGFAGCTQLTNCIGSGQTLAGTGYAFESCRYISGCKAGAASTTAIWGGTVTYRDDDSCQLA